MKKRDIYFKGWYGYRNIGDDIFCVTADWICSNLWENTRAVFIGPYLPEISGKALKIQVKNKLMKNIFEIYYTVKSDAILYFGGSLFSTLIGRMDLRSLIKKFPRLNSKLGLFGSSIGPFEDESGQTSVKQLLEKSNFIAVRDNASIDELKNMGLCQDNENVFFSFDIAILLTDVFQGLKTKKVKKGKTIGVNLHNCLLWKFKNSTLRIKEFIEEIVKQDPTVEEIVFLNFYDHKQWGDQIITNQFIESLEISKPIRVISYTSNTEEFLCELNNCNFILGTRLHCGIASYALGIPFILIEYEAKCSDFLNTINHKFRFNFHDTSENITIYNTIIKEGGVPNIINPEYFKEKMYNVLSTVYKKL